MKIRDDIFIYYARQNGKYYLSWQQLLEKIKEIQKYNSEY